VVRGPSGSYVAEWLAGLIAGWGRWQDCVWLRTPATQPLAGRLLQACRWRWAGDDQEQPLTGPAGQVDQALRLTPRGGSSSWSWTAGPLPGWPGWVRPSARSPGTGACG
jgi:hypothetical protein